MNDSVKQSARLSASVASWGLRLALTSAGAFAVGMLVAMLAGLFLDNSSLIGLMLEAVCAVLLGAWMLLWPAAGMLGIVALWKARQPESPAREFTKGMVTLVLCLLSLIASCWALYGFASSI